MDFLLHFLFNLPEFPRSPVSVIIKYLNFKVVSNFDVRISNLFFSA